MYHTCAFNSNLLAATNAQTVKALADNVFKIGSSNGFVLQEDMMLLGAKYSGVGARAGKLTSPKLNQFQSLFLTPLDVTLESTNPHLIALWPYRPFTFRNQEEVTAIADNTDAGAQQACIVAHFSNGIEQVPSGEILTITGVGTTAAVANSWTLQTFTLDQTLPEGVYAMVASECQSTTAIAHRFTFWNQFYRPGHTSTTSYGNQQSEPIRWLTFGLMGRFSNVTLPNLEVLCRTTDATHTFRWRCIKVA